MTSPWVHICRLDRARRYAIDGPHGDRELAKIPGIPVQCGRCGKALESLRSDVHGPRICWECRDAR